MFLTRFGKGVNQFFPPYQIGDDEFFALQNATSRRGVVTKKLGNQFLGQLQTTLTIGGYSTNSLGNFYGEPTYSSTFTSLVPGTLDLTIGATTYSDNSMGTIINNSTSLPAGNIVYTTGLLNIVGQAPLTPITGTVGGTPGLPVMGIATLVVGANQFYPLFFDTTYAYQYNGAFFSVSYFAMPTPANPCTWQGTSYQQFDFANFDEQLFITNNVPGMQYRAIASLTAVGTIITLGVPNHGLVVNDQLFFYQVAATNPGPNASLTSINGLVGTVTVVVSVNTVTVSVPLLAATSGVYTGNGIVQYLTSTAAIPGVQGLRYYTTSPIAGFVNFSPPLLPSNLLDTNGNVIPVTYLVGAKLLVVFGNRLIALGCYEQTAGGTIQFYPDRIRFSQINTALYQLIPSAWWDVPSGNGGFLDLGGNQPITATEIANEVLLVGLAAQWRKVLPTGNSILPFIDKPVSIEYGCICPFSTVPLENATVSIANNGIVLTSANSSQRVDATLIPDAVNDISKANFGPLRVCSIRDYVQQLIYWTYPQSDSTFPNQTIVWNYIENNWSFYTETFTCYGYYLGQLNSRTWGTPGLDWANAGPWGQNLGELNTAMVAAGTPWGSVVLKGLLPVSQPNMPITSITVGPPTILTIPNHNLLSGQFLYIDSATGSGLANTNVMVTSILSANTFTISTTSTGGYPGGGLANVVDNFAIVTKQYCPNSAKGLTQELNNLWLLLGTTTEGAISVSLTSNYMEPTYGAEYNAQPLPYVIPTTPDTNLGLTGTEGLQSFIWHRLQPDFSGQTIQLSLFLTEAQMFNVPLTQSTFSLGGLYIEFSESGSSLA
jgi:hypothetical protein